MLRFSAYFLLLAKQLTFNFSLNTELFFAAEGGRMGRRAVSGFFACEIEELDSSPCGLVGVVEL